MDITKGRSHLWSHTLLKKRGHDHIEGRTNYIREIDAVLTLDAIDRLLLGPCPRP